MRIVKKALMGTLVLGLILSCAVPSTVTASATGVQSNSRLQQIVSDLKKADGKIPKSITRNDMQLFLNEGGDQVGPILENIRKHSKPAELLAGNKKSVENRTETSRYSYAHNALTNTTTYVDGKEFNSKVPDGQVSEGTTGLSDLPDKVINPMSYPYDWNEENPQNYSNTRSTCALTVVYNNGSTEYGSGFLISDTRIATAGHVIYNGEWPNYIIITPSNRSSSPTAPYGTAMDTGNMEAGGNFVNSGDENDDWGTVELNRSFSDVGYMGIMKPGDNIVGWWIRAEGYPAPTMRLTGGNITQASGRYIRATNTVVPGMSGGPVLEDRDYIIGIVQGYYSSGSHMVKFDDWLYNKMVSYR